MIEANTFHLTDHVFERWMERFPEDMEGKSNEEKEKLIRDWLKDSYPIFSMKDPDTKDDMVFMYKDYKIILICSNNRTVITVFPTDYNHHEDIDKMIANQLYKKILEIDEQILRERNNLDNTVQAIDTDIDTIEEQLKELQRKSDQLKSKKQTLLAKREEAFKTFDVLLGERDTFGKQLAYSSTYRSENKVNEIKRLDAMISSSIITAPNRRRR